MKATEQNDKLRRAIILSIALHCILIAVLIWSSIHQPQESSAAGGGSSIDSVMVDPYAVVLQQYNRQQQQTDTQRAQQQRDKQAQQQREKFQKKQAADQQPLKVLENQRLAAQEAAEEQQRDQAEQQKQAQETAKQAQAQQKQAEATAAKQRVKVKKAATVDTKAKVDQVAKDKADVAKMAAAQAAKQSSDVDALLGALITAKNAPKAEGTLAWVDKAKQSGASWAEIDAYKAQISRAISDKFYDSSSYSGRTCDLRIKLAPDGLMISVTAVGGDPALCQAAVSAAELATIPRPPSPQIYEIFKNATLGFSPQ